ncbi:MAG: hypothetical protein WBB44_10675 [Candidatus Nanopelagicales bacterium]|nr:helix-turn-helix transcriptional regulator [Candidatus Nanopelagicales bacterium]
MKDETEEWLDELVRSWTETFKKSLTTLELMRAVAALAPAPANTIGQRLAQQTGWSLTDRGLYRSLRRLTTLGLLRVDEVAVARTGAKRKDYSLTTLGVAYLERIEKVVAQAT